MSRTKFSIVLSGAVLGLGLAVFVPARLAASARFLDCQVSCNDGSSCHISCPWGCEAWCSASGGQNGDAQCQCKDPE